MKGMTSPQRCERDKSETKLTGLCSSCPVMWRKSELTSPLPVHTGWAVLCVCVCLYCSCVTAWHRIRGDNGRAVCRSCLLSARVDRAAWHHHTVVWPWEAVAALTPANRHPSTVDVVSRTHPRLKAQLGPEQQTVEGVFTWYWRLLWIHQTLL